MKYKIGQMLSGKHTPPKYLITDIHGDELLVYDVSQNFDTYGMSWEFEGWGYKVCSTIFENCVDELKMLAYHNKMVSFIPNKENL